MKRLLPAILLALCIGRLWLMQLPSSFWVDEAETVFVAHYGYDHPSMAAVPQMRATDYFYVPRAFEKILGYSEEVYRLPSILAMGLALFLVARLAMRLIHPAAGWFAAFACLALRPINYEAANARPYALGICVSALSVWLLVRWLDSARWMDGFLFVAAAAMLWRVQLIYWPFYLIFGLYALVRIFSKDARVAWSQVGIMAAVLGVLLLPVLKEALTVNREASAHVFSPMPNLRAILDSTRYRLALESLGGAILAALILRWPRAKTRIAGSAIALVLSWWLIQPLGLVAYSRLTGFSVFSPRYVSIALPGAALVATLAVSYLIPDERRWWWASLALGVGALVTLGQWKHLWIDHHTSDWRAASQAVNALGIPADTPVLLPSPFIEARPPEWSPNYPLPGFLYCNLTVYPITGKPYLLPFDFSVEGRDYVEQLSRDVLPKASRFLIYGNGPTVHTWREWVAQEPALRSWKSRFLPPFGDVEVAVFEAP